ncbi:hypothetical protein RT717_13930 [Imperialibacter roseus]|uniref:Seryl-tRNA synthetase n=1 Tax=Imperialibacter roseus TaxID=1324217 RepID=A0ABZ0IGK7_9BACT|nr:hypothetical protein [Imperialibacter roseus]WOK04174.1 hypothetical protein RT717_13930 [Imperialibacter roseus]
MKKIRLTLTTLLLLFILFPGSVSASNVIAPAPTAAETAEANALLARLSEIDALDKAGMSSSEKKELRKEVKATKSRLRAIGGGVYVSVGALIIILLLLIILL